MLQLMHMRFARFLAVGLLNAFFGYGCFAIFLFIGLHYVVALFLATCIGILFNFKTTGYWVFESKDNRRVLHFISVYIVTYGVNVACLKILSLLGIAPYFGGALLILPMAALAYLLNKWFVFKND
ncbi:MAG TPA: GtrA family protein [Burkholderiaceae bacterium]|jgi:putative flippase GtrA